MSDLEIDRARATSNAHRVLPLTRFIESARARKRRAPHIADVIAEVLRDLRVRGVVVPENFPAGIAERLRKAGRAVSTAPEPFFPTRMIKTKDEIVDIKRVMRSTEKGMQAAIDLLRTCRIEKGWVVHKRRRLTSEGLRRVANAAIFDEGCVPTHTIVAAGKHGCDPHNAGSGPIRAGAPIIIDIFPRSERTGYFADMTRTVVKGKASDEVHAMYRAVLAAQRLGVRMIRAGVDARTIHTAIHALFEKKGYQTGELGGRMQGFFHGTGHGLGLEIHEPPRIGAASVKLKANMVVTVEPGLYYYPTGGVRIEDTVLVTKDGVKNLTRFPKFLEID